MGWNLAVQAFKHAVSNSTRREGYFQDFLSNKTTKHGIHWRNITSGLKRYLLNQSFIHSGWIWLGTHYLVSQLNQPICIILPSTSV